MNIVVRIHPEEQDNKEVTALVLKGKVNIEGMEFHHIEGGFGEGKRTMLVKEIASIHGKELKHINEAINSNRKRFRDSVDILDIKGSAFAVDLADSEIYTRNSMNASKNIYVLSLRGYSKLLKILEDDVAWDQFDKLVDGYFNMKQIIQEQCNPMLNLLSKDPVLMIRYDQLQMKDELHTIGEKVQAIEARLDKQPEFSGTYKSSVPQIGTGVTNLTTPEDASEKWYTCKDIANLVNLRWPKYQTLGRLASKHNLKTEQYSKTIDISATKTPGRVLFQQTVYNEAGKDKLLDIIKGTVAGRKLRRKARRRRR